ncbi:spore germination lipoprotein GerD [Pontibacillus yanchengensis]|uniref:Spore gernimation protein GerD n=1 Tax=Pontibacillus yanchengensis Y32 TaxID=1385514 RepID=A0A0A2TA39_9BACI|nr:spore germination lipoprotein GerD [Pontibacillus yanchengensis]KGP70936.1 spore gernimation protein GerD [Pontibacillus yanchengensis Y32]
MLRIKNLIVIVASLSFLTACTGNSSSGGEQPQYETTKKMVVDILKTDDGKKAITEVLNDDKMKQQVVLESDVVKKSIEETITSDKGKKFWTKLFENPQFSKTFAQSMTEEQKKLTKDLMSDSEYQKSMLEILQNPEITNQMLTVMKSQQFRAHLEKTIEETMNTPMFKAKMSEIVLKAAEEMKSSSGGEKSEGEGEGQGGDQQSKSGEGSSGAGGSQGGGGS